jgi:hypothetical protein
MFEGPEARAEVDQPNTASFEVHVKSIPSYLSMYNPLAVVENLEAFGGTDGEVEESPQRHWLLGHEFLAESLMLVPHLPSSIPSWSVVDNLRKVVGSRMYEYADDNRTLIPLLTW